MLCPKRVLHIYGSPSDSKHYSKGLAVINNEFNIDDGDYFINDCLEVFHTVLSADRVPDVLANLLEAYKPHVTVAGAGLVNVLATACMADSNVVIGVPLGGKGNNLSSVASLLDKAPGCPIACMPPNAASEAVNLALLMCKHDYQIYSDDPKGILADYGINFNDFGFDSITGSALLIVDYKDPQELKGYEDKLSSDSIIIAYNSTKFTDDEWPQWIEGMTGLKKTLFVGNGRVKNAFHLAVQIKSIHDPSIRDKIIIDKEKSRSEKYGGEIKRVEDFINNRR